MIENLLIIKAQIFFNIKKDMAYALNNWSSLLSTTMYTIAILVFINVLYTNINLIAGYNKNEVLFFFLVGQLTFYFNWNFNMYGLQSLIQDVNQGQFDLVLLKPASSYLLSMSKNIKVLPLFYDGLAPTLAIIFSIKWSELHITPINLLIGIILFILGLFIYQVFFLIASLPVFWLGESSSILDLAGSISAVGGNTTIPLEGYPKHLIVTFSSILPILYATPFVTSAILNKSNPFFLLLITIIMFNICIIIRKFAWNFALRHYTSASS